MVPVFICSKRATSSTVRRGSFSIMSALFLQKSLTQVAFWGSGWPVLSLSEGLPPIPVRLGFFPIRNGQLSHPDSRHSRTALRLPPTQSRQRFRWACTGVNIFAGPRLIRALNIRGSLKASGTPSRDDFHLFGRGADSVISSPGLPVLAESAKFMVTVWPDTDQSSKKFGPPRAAGTRIGMEQRKVGALIPTQIIP